MSSIVVVLALGLMQGNDDTNFVAAVRDTYNANLEELRSGSLYFTLASGTSADLKSALSGRWSSRVEAECSFYSDGKNSRFECLYKPEDLHRYRKPINDRQFASSLMPIRILTDGTMSLIDRLGATPDGKGLIHAPRLFPGKFEFYQNLSLPLALGGNGAGYLHLGADIDGALLNRPEWRLAEISDRDSIGKVNVVKLTFKAPDRSRVYWVDIERGAIPLKIESYHKGELLITFVRENLRLLSNKGWYPMREVSFVKGGKTREHMIREKSDFGVPPNDSEFRLQFPQPQRLVNQALLVNYAPRNVWDLRKLPSPSSAGTQRLVVAKSPAGLAQMPAGEREAPPNWAMPLTLVGLILLAIVALRVKVRFRHA